MTQHDYKAALSWIDARKGCNFQNDIIPSELSSHREAIHHALKVADKLMQEPSEGIAGWNAGGILVGDAFKAMRAQMLEEVE